MAFDPYGTSTITHTYQNLQMEDEKRENTNDEIINGFYKFIKEYKIDNVYKYR